ncbi:hypothetical protein GGS26DRAFT_587797 [Hypomontagnella submonticulosa]|nr:hypothetical protein GGS26DRAFT_587797 [Hypomontagnella submonticulosa]
MESYVRQVPIGDTLVEVAQYAIVKKAFFVISATGSRDAWPKIFDQHARSIWIYATPSIDPSTPKPNPWKIAVELDTKKLITLELYDTTLAERGTVVIIRTLTDNQDPNADFGKLLSLRATCLGRKMMGNFTFGSVLLKLQEKNLFMYQLNAGRGYRHWVYSVVKALDEQYIYRAPMAQFLSQEIDDKMRRCWLPNGNPTGRPGYEDELDNPMNIVPGKC